MIAGSVEDYDSAPLTITPNHPITMEHAKTTQALTVVIPFYNEASCIEKTLRTLVNQSSPPSEFLLINNRSDDNSVDICNAFFQEQSSIPYRIIDEETPGKIHALERAMPEIKTPLVAFCDADTLYPTHYFALAHDLLDHGTDKISAVMALGVDQDSNGKKARFQRKKGVFVGKLLSKQCHTGGYGHIFKTERLRAAGGYSAEQWPFVLEDHEIIHRVLKTGSCVYHTDLWCIPSDRRHDRTSVSWTLSEQILYHLTPFFLKDWFFYQFLASRFKRKGMGDTALRERNWETPTAEGSK